MKNSLRKQGLVGALSALGIVGCALTLVLLLSLPTAQAAEEDAPLPLPRFVSLRAPEANLRSGPGTRYPILWVYHKEGMPLEILEEYNTWRKVRDVDGATGWVLKGMLSGARHALVRGGTHYLRRAPEIDAAPLLALQANVLGALTQCQKDWCQMRVDTRLGWIEKTALWGVYPSEMFEK